MLNFNSAITDRVNAIQRNEHGEAIGRRRTANTPWNVPTRSESIRKLVSQLRAAEYAAGKAAHLENAPMMRARAIEADAIATRLIALTI